MSASDHTRFVTALATRQGGLIRADQLDALGLTRNHRQTLLDAGVLNPLYADVYAVGHTHLDQSARYRAAAWSLGPDAVVGHHSAAAHLGLTAHGGSVHIIVPAAHGLAHRGDVRVHRQALRPAEITVVDGVPCTTLVRTTLDVAATAPRILERVFEEAQIRHRLRPEELAVALVTRPGHRGTRRVRELLAGAVDPGRVESVLELRFLELCGAYGLPRPLCQIWFGRYRVDFWFKEARLAVETDGRRFHLSAAKQRADKRKEEDVIDRGQRMLRLRWVDVVDRSAQTAAILHRALAG